MKITILLVLIILGCSTLDKKTSDAITSELPNTFTNENILNTHEGMTSDLIMKMYGAPKKVSQDVCGAKYGSPWSCITWEYGQFPYDRASFTFNGDGAEPVINNFEIVRTKLKLPEEFTTESVLKIKQGISSAEIFKMFGAPASVNQSVCGAETKNTWQCTTWEYGQFPYDRASFTFSGNHKSLILNNFSVDRK